MSTKHNPDRVSPNYRGIKPADQVVKQVACLLRQVPLLDGPGLAHRGEDGWLQIA